MNGQFGDPRLERLYRYWRSKRDDRGLVRRGDIDMSDITEMLPIINLIEVLGEPRRFMHRLVGTEIVETMGRDATGQVIGPGLYGDVAEQIVASLESAVRDLRAYRRVAHLAWHTHNWLEMETVELPLVGDSGGAVALLCGACFRRRDAGPGARLVHEPLPDADDAT